AEEDLAKIRPDLDGNEIMRILQIPPGPLVGKAWRHLKELRLERGPLERDEAVAELLAWAKEQGIEVPENAADQVQADEQGRAESWRACLPDALCAKRPSGEVVEFSGFDACD